MARIQVKKTTIKNKNNSNSQKKLQLRRVAINNSMSKMRAAMR